MQRKSHVKSFLYYVNVLGQVGWRTGGPGWDDSIPENCY